MKKQQQPPPPSTLYRDLVDAGADMANHESDLYVVVTPEATAIIARYKDMAKVKTFTSQTDGKLNYTIDFGYDPFWEAKEKQRRPR